MMKITSAGSNAPNYGAALTDAAQEPGTARSGGNVSNDLGHPARPAHSGSAPRNATLTSPARAARGQPTLLGNYSAATLKAATELAMRGIVDLNMRLGGSIAL
ncbi:MAG TPA: hypothetical protein VFP68_02510 [Burkholderiaceae bacterium]|nr:hypothetical protein [Burkholderiaceae bacterium]